MGQENTAFSNLDERRSQDSENKSNKSNKVELYKIKSWRQDEYIIDSVYEFRMNIKYLKVQYY